MSIDYMFYTIFYVSPNKFLIGKKSGIKRAVGRVNQAVIFTVFAAIRPIPRVYYPFSKKIMHNFDIFLTFFLFTYCKKGAIILIV